MKIALICVALAAAVTGCGDDSTTTTSSSPQSTPTSTPTESPEQRDEAAVRAVILDHYKADSIGDYEAVCSYFTAEAAEEKVQGSAPGAPAGTSCAEAMAIEAEDLGAELLADSNRISANATVESVVVGRDTAQAILDLGGPDPSTMELQRVGDRWLISKDTSWWYRHSD